MSALLRRRPSLQCGGTHKGERMNELQDKVGIVVGGAGGIGLAVVRGLLALGARVVIVDLGTSADGTAGDAAVVALAAETVTRTSGDVVPLALDAGSTDAARSMVEATLERYGRVDFGVYCAGFQHDRPLLRDGDDDLARVLSVHVLGAVRFTRELARAMIAAKHGGSVILTTSAAAFFGSAGQSALAVAAGGLVGFVKTAATELRRHKIRVNAIVPTARTRLTAQLPLFESIRADSLTPEHVAQGICHLLSDAAEDVLGEVIGIAGGRLYAFRHAETSGAFLEGPEPPTLAAIAAAWPDVSRR